MNEQPKWLEKAKETYGYHRLQLLSHDKWTIAMTAKSLRRSIGSVCEDLLIARWAKTHEKQIEKLDTAYKALKFIKNKKREQDLSELE